MSDFVRRAEALIETVEELEHWLSIGVVCLAHWNQQGGFYLAPAQIIGVKEDKVLVDHWETVWMSFSSPLFKIKQGYY